MNTQQFREYWIPESNSGCWLWLGNTRSGYGQARVSKRHISAHRLSWQLANGEIPAGMCVLHRCDTPLCVNPAHLFLGTHADNMRDRDKKKRQPIGERNGRAKLTVAQVSEIRSSNESYRKLAKRFGVSHHQIFVIKTNKQWKQIEITQNEIQP